MKSLDVTVNKNGEVIVDLHTGEECGQDLDAMINQLRKEGVEVKVTNKTDRSDDDGRGIPIKC